MNFTYPKKERLCSKILIDNVFNEGKKIYGQLFKIIWLPIKLTENVPVQSLIGVPKHRFKRANKRNLLKRRTKEAFRKSKFDLYQPIEAKGIQIALVIIYNSGSLKDYLTIEKDLKLILTSLTNQILKNN